MTFEMSEILKSKRELRQKLATLPIIEKLRLLDQLRGRSLDIAASRASLATSSHQRTSQESSSHV